MDNEENFLFYILKKPYSNRLKENYNLPLIIKVKDTDSSHVIYFTDPNESEGPFQSVHELRKKSTIFNTIKLQKQKDRISKNKNIETLKEGLLIKSNTPFEEIFFDSFSHIVIGKFSRKKLKGVHFYDPEKIKIVERITTNKDTGVWSAKIKKQNEITGEWIEKGEMSNFFPESWSISKTIIECDYAYRNRTFDSGKTYYSKTKSGIQVKFIIDKENKVITFYPLFK